MSLTQILKNKNLWPSKNEESWRYFDFKSFESLLKESDLKSYDFKIDYSLDLVSEIIVAPDLIRVSSNLRDRLRFESVESTKTLNPESNIDFRLTALNLLQRNLVIHIENQKELSFKLTYQFKSEVSSQDIDSLNLGLQFKIVNSNVSMLEQDSVLSGSYFSNHMQIQLLNSSFEHISLYANSGQATSSTKAQAKIINSEVRVGKQSVYKNTSLILNNRFIRTQQSVALESEGSVGHLNAFNISEDQSFSELRTEVLHLRPKTESRQLFKTIAADQSKSIFNGRIYVNPTAQKTDAAQLCQGILLHPKAEINAKPELEIYADDVKAAHGAAIGQLGQDQVFYLISRGIKPELAYKMLSKAFAGEILASIANQQFRTLCQTTIDSSSEAIFEKLAENITSSGQKR